MDYFLLSEAIDTADTGHVYPAVETHSGYDFNSLDSAHNLAMEDFPSFTPNLKFNLVWGAKLTDVLSQGTISARGILVSKRLKEIFEKFESIPNKFYPAIISTNEKDIEYYWLHLVWKNGVDNIDYKNSKWRIKRASKVLGEITLNSRDEHLKKQGELGFIKMIHGYPVVLQNPNTDLFFDPINFGIIISLKLKQELEQENITGIQISEYDGLIIK